MTPADIMALQGNHGNDGFLEGNGIIILILFFLIFGFGGGGFGGGWGGNNAATQGALTRAELYEGLNTQSIERDLKGIQNGICDGFYANNTTMLNGFAGVNQSLNCGFNSVNQNLNNGFNSVNQNINQLGFNMQQCCCELKTAIHSEGEATRDMLQANLIQDLRDKVADKDRELLATGLVTAQSLQTQNLENFMRQMNNSCGCGFGGYCS